MWRRINHIWRKPIEGSHKGLEKIVEHGHTIVLVTSRKGYNRQTTMGWIRRWDYEKFYSSYHFNDLEVGGADSKVKNIKKVKSDIHIDDNWETVIKLAESYPDMELWYLGEETSNKHNNIKIFENWTKIVENIG